MAELRSTGECPQNTQFYVCQLSGFRGCCHYDPCDSRQGCSDSSDSSDLSDVMQSEASSTVATTSIPLPSSTSRWNPPTSTTGPGVPSATRGSKDTQNGSSGHVPIIIGTVTAGGAILIIVIAFILLRRRKKRRDEASESTATLTELASSPTFKLLDIPPISELAGSTVSHVAPPTASQRRSTLFCPDGACPALSHKGYHDESVNGWSRLSGYA
ncbi:hypothetical protein F4679DRAFT_583882 [Xylaria curta]|nr:hypothetical protein F4679DRAFT_583882 [Xylaria curta]